jgi:Tfp pilus assembly protein PilW
MDKTASRISFIPRTKRPQFGGFTLVELIVGATISGFILTGVLTSFLMLGRLSTSVQQYTEIEAKARKSLEQLSRDVRLAYFVNAASATSVELWLPDSTSTRNVHTTTVIYTYDATNSKITRSEKAEPSGTAVVTDLVTGVQPITGTNVFNYYRYNTAAGYVDGFNTANVAATTAEIKQLTVDFLLARTRATVTAATNKVLSARFILRNK